MAVVTDQFFDWEAAVDPSVMWDFWALPNGHIRCEECGTQAWCEHIEAMVKGNGDAGSIHSRYAEGEIFSIEIPMFPSVNLWQRVCLHPHEKLHAFVAFLDDDNPDRQYRLGFINPGEGRNVIRQIIFDWFVGMVETGGLECRSHSHKYAAQIAWERATKFVPKGMMSQNHFSVWQSGSCLHCRNLTGMHDPDLIPDPGTTGPKPWEK